MKLRSEVRSIPVYYLASSLFNSAISDIIASISMIHLPTGPFHFIVLSFGVPTDFDFHFTLASLVQHCSASQISNLSPGSFSGYLRVKPPGLQFGISYFKTSFLCYTLVLAPMPWSPAFMVVLTTYYPGPLPATVPVPSHQ